MSGVTQHVNATFDIASGVKKYSIDQNSNQTNFTYDSLLRPASVGYSDGGATTWTYSLTSGSPYIATSILHASGSTITQTSHVDAYGRLSETESTDSPHDDFTDYSYNQNGNPSSVSNPYRSGDTPVYTVYTYDALNRLLNVQESDSSQIGLGYVGNAVTLTDEASHQRKLVYDGIGRIESVFEPDGSGSLTLETDYLYGQNYTYGSSENWYQNIIEQKGGSSNSSQWRTRTFTFDLPGRLLQETTPEGGTTAYTYMVGSSYCSGVPTAPCTRSDANGTVTTYSYDALNRLTGKSYGGSSIGTSTPAVAYYYDQSSYNGLTIANGLGRETGMSDGSGSTAWSFDTMGRPAAVRRTLNSVTKQANYTYNPDGTVNTLQDFSGTTFSYGYDTAGRQTGVSGGAGNSYANSATYNAASLLTGLTQQMTSSNPIYSRTIGYNNRLQVASIAASLGSTNIQNLTYGYGTGGTDNGNILFITNGMDPTHSRDQSYSYDTLNRLATGHDGSHWGESYVYDNWGNMYQDNRLSGYSNGGNWNVTADTSNHLSNLSYDSAGQVTMDQFSNSYSYDAEGRILSAGSGSYAYDGNGYRVKKTVGGTTTLYWPGAAGDIIDESNSGGTSFGRQVALAGLRVWSETTSGTGVFLFQDHLGSTRVTGDASGNPKDDIDYYPFGGTETNYGTASANHYLFTGYESDASESSTDYAVYRNLSYSMGRFNRPDPSDGSYKLTDPQSFNRYTYLGNRPLGLIDPLGLDPTCGDGINDWGCMSDGNGLGDPGYYVDQYGNYYYWNGSSLYAYTPTNVNVN